MEISRGGVLSAAAMGGRIRAIRKSRKMTQREFSASLGIAQGFLCSIEKGKKVPSVTLMIALQYLYEINPQWLENGSGDMFQSGPVASASGPAGGIPLLQAAPVSLESIIINDSTEYISLPQVPADCFAFVYSGDFMSPTIRDGDMVVIKPDMQPVSGDIILIVGRWGESFLRRYRKIGDEVFCSADNSSYSSFKPGSELKIIGTVHAVWRKIRI